MRPSKKSPSVPSPGMELYFAERWSQSRSSSSSCQTVLIIGVYNVTKKSYQEVTNGVTQDASKHGGAAVAGDLMVFPPLAQGYIGLLDISGDISAWVYETFDITTFGIARSSKFLDAAAVGNKVINHPQQPSATQWSLHPTRPHLCGQSQWDREEVLRTHTVVHSSSELCMTMALFCSGSVVFRRAWRQLRRPVRIQGVCRLRRGGDCQAYDPAENLAVDDDGLEQFLQLP